MSECLSYNGSVKIDQSSCIPVELLLRRYAAIRVRLIEAGVILRNALMGLLQVISLQINGPKPVEFIQCPDIFQLAFPEKCINDLVEPLYLSLGFTALRSGVYDSNAKPG